MSNQEFKNLILEREISHEYRMRITGRKWFASYKPIHIWYAVTDFAENMLFSLVSRILYKNYKFIVKEASKRAKGMSTQELIESVGLKKRIKKNQK